MEKEVGRGEGGGMWRRRWQVAEDIVEDVEEHKVEDMDEDLVKDLEEFWKGSGWSQF